MSRKKKYLTTLPVSRIKKIMQLDDEIGKISVDTPFLVAKALERFLTDLIENACNLASTNNHKRIYPRHMKEIISSTEMYEFLVHLVEKIQGGPFSEEGAADAPPPPPTQEKTPKKKPIENISKTHVGGPKVDGIATQGKRGRPRKTLFPPVKKSWIIYPRPPQKLPLMKRTTIND
ncbi:hypothetical protein DI09_26p40 [Mitosporidium daphniae]|uniref:Transcription factor CBF/NF-Y/archaeal histone domain-containing protein n=1 Tax=Mitosporidium daphniae TaxID=1485682 RepID=A0A098VSP6_9MICR|nr:uncharacterized protein DI09_26p40 [Mitosporidium daphniae]KGG51804.1 hypothetical protein DI09_26p40 [Mitosporidium daphniae]|eukprot:XP_013238260.1 uncharacterized protein DI09_26p40 [Mitosporidium daphniae]